LWLKAYEIPATERYSKGKAMVNLLGLKDETVTNVISVKSFEDFYLWQQRKELLKEFH